MDTYSASKIGPWPNGKCKVSLNPINIYICSSFQIICYQIITNNTLIYFFPLYIKKPYDTKIIPDYYEF